MSISQFKSHVESFTDSGVWSHYFSVPNKIANQFKEESRRVICTLNREYKFHCALMHDGKGGFFILLNKEVRNKLHVEEGDAVFVELTKDLSEYGMNVPQVFSELLNQDEEGSRIFHNLTRGKQRNLIYIVNKVKSEQLKIHKTSVILNYLKTVKGKLDFKELNQAFKENPFSLKN